MSLLQRKITRLQRHDVGGFGFGAAQREHPRAMLLAAYANDAEEVAARGNAGVDVVIVRTKDAGKAIAKAGLKDIATGAWADSLDDTIAEKLKEAGCDFVISDLDGTAAAAVDTGRMGQVIVADGVDDTTLRALAPLGLDAIFVDQPAEAMTLRQQLGLVRLSSFASTALIVPIAPEATVNELRVLRDSGTAVVVAAEQSSIDALKELGERLRQVPTPRRSRDGRDMALVPSVSQHHEEEEDEPGEI